jgi:hypothetical protein
MTSANGRMEGYPQQGGVATIIDIAATVRLF